MKKHALISVSNLIVLFLLAASLAVVTHAQIPDRNINMVSGTGWPDGDPFLQRQNEPSIAVSSRNPLNLLAGANDYRTVDLPGLPNGQETGDAWLGVFRSKDGGLTWRSTLLHGYPQDNSPEGTASPNKGFQGAADPTVRPGTNGLFYYSGIVFNRDAKNLGQIFVARFIDNNNSEVEDTVQYLDTHVIQGGTAGQFIDKPWLGVDIPRQGAGQCQIPAQSLPDGNVVGAQTFPAGNVYLAQSIFLGTDTNNNPHTAIMFARSTNCGVTWTVSKISESFKWNQGTTVAISPKDGTIFVAWRQFKTVNDADSIIFVKSTDGGKSFSKGTTVAIINPFDQPTTPYSFRTSTFPTMAVDGTGRVYIAWAQKGLHPQNENFSACDNWPTACSDSRIVVSSSSNGTSWSTPSPADGSLLRGNQIMPALSFAAGKLMLVYYDFREDHTIGLFHSIVDPTNGLKTGFYSDTREEVGNRPNNPENVFTDLIADIAPPLLRRHTIDVRAVQADISSTNPAANGTLTFKPSVRVSQYVFGNRPTSSEIQPLEADSNLPQQLQVNPPNLPLFKQGTVPFIGDYIDVAAAMFAKTAVTQANPGGWMFNTAPSDSVVFHATWTDDRDVRPPPTGYAWTNYTPADSTAKTLMSRFDPSQTVPSCNPDFTGTRNQNVYTSRITQGLFLAAAGNNKPLLTVDGSQLQRTFSIFLQNTTYIDKSFTLSVGAPKPSGFASFDQFQSVSTLTITVGPRSTASRPVFVTSPDRHATVVVTASEIVSSGVPLAGSVVLNPDPTNPDLLNDLGSGTPDIANVEVYNPDITTILPNVLTQDLANQDLANQDLANQDLANQDLANQDIANFDIVSQDLANQDLANQDLANQDLANQDLANTSLSDATWTVKNDGNTTTSYAVKLLQNIPAPSGAKLQLVIYRTTTAPAATYICPLADHGQNLVVANVTNPLFTSTSDLPKADLNNPARTNATITLAPKEQAKLTVRVFRPTGSTFDPADAISPVLVAHGVNTEDKKPGGTNSPRVTLTVTTTMGVVPDAVKSHDYSLTLQAIGGIGPYSWSLYNSVLPAGLSLNGSTGVISGKPTVRGTTTFKVQVTDSSSPAHVALRTLKITVL